MGLQKELLAALVLLLAAPATADAYVRLAAVRTDAPAAIAGSEVLIGVQAPTGATLTAYSLDGSARTLPLPGAGAQIVGLAASKRLVAVT
ncbi:MAG: hypothetical protein QOE86_2234, partial [Solirubrobacteraceae bacterium]|nr:hypothetical protein [Solirubrobacteraceae bacterium]